MLNNVIDRIKLPFRKEKELYVSLYRIMGFYPRDIALYKLALMHKSMFRRNAKGKPVNNERLEFLGDAILDAAVGDIVYRHFPGKREGFLTNTRSKLVQRETLGRLAQDMGITQLILSSGRSSSHNSYMGGNAFEALVGALYLDRGYDACMRFIEKRILAQMINIDKVAYKEVNFKSKLIEWTQKNRVQLSFALQNQRKDKNGSPVFTYRVLIEGIEGCEASGYSKKESQQLASRRTLEKLKKEPQYLDAVFAAKTDRTKMEEEPVIDVPGTEQSDAFFTESAKQAEKEASQQARRTAAGSAQADGSEEMRQKAENGRQTGHSLRRPPMYAGHGENAAEGQETASAPVPAVEVYTESSSAADDEFDLSDITHRDKSREDIIAEAERRAFEQGEQ